MPYDTKTGTGKDKGKTCVFKKNGGAKVGCTAGSVKKYLAALHVNANESLTKDVLMGLIEEILEEEYQFEAKTKTSPTGREETPCKGRGCVTKQRPEIRLYAKDIGKEMKSGKIKKTYIDKKTGKRKETNKYALATHAAKQSGSMRGKDFARKVPKNVNPKTGAKKKSLDEKELEEKRRKPYDKAHGRKYKSEVGTKKQDERNQRKRDKEKHDKENGKCPSGQELHHTKGLKSSSVKCEPVSKNRGRKEKSRLEERVLTKPIITWEDLRNAVKSAQGVSRASGQAALGAKAIKTTADFAGITPPAVDPTELAGIPDLIRKASGRAAKHTQSGILGFLNIDNKYLSILDDKLETEFLNWFADKISTNTGRIRKGENINDFLQNFLAQRFDGRTVTGQEAGGRFSGVRGGRIRGSQTARGGSVGAAAKTGWDKLKNLTRRSEE